MESAVCISELTLTNNVPSYTVKSIEFVSFSGTEAGQFKFVMECTATIGITNTCVSVPFANVDYLLVQDTKGSNPTKAQLNAIFAAQIAAGNIPKVITVPADRVAPGALGTTNGGFQTVILTGPVPLATKPNMYLLLRSYGVSYKYFNIDVTTAPVY
jgi:hypothetical protein